MLTTSLLRFALLAPRLFAAAYSTSYQLGDVTYYIPEKLELEHDFGFKDTIPVTVLTPKSNILELDYLNKTISQFLATDDVFTEGFLNGLILQGPNGIQISSTASTFLNAAGNRHVWMGAALTQTQLSDGPYFATRYGLHRAWRFYDDYTNSFVLPTHPSPHDPNFYQPMSVQSPSQLGYASIAVPSRLFYKATEHQPLAGLRIGVKDSYDLNGVLTTWGSRSYANTYPVANLTSGVIQPLLDQGAIIVGKTKLSMFADALFTSNEFVDYMLPVNPRGDGYQTPASSSTGSGSSMAAYDWLDNTVGEDTGGSVRFPAALNGLFGLRASINSTNAYATGFGPFDTAGHFARDVDSLNTFGRGMYSTAGYKNYTSFPTKILYPAEYWAGLADNYTAPCEEYVKHMESFLGVQCMIIDTNEIWTETSGHGNVSIGAYFRNTSTTVQAVATLRQKLVVDHAAKFEGAAPYITINGRGRRNLTTVSPADIQKGNSERVEFQNWYRSHILPSNDQTCSDTIVVFPFNGNGGFPWYRDNVTSDGFAKIGPNYLSWNRLSPLNGHPEITVPVGEVGYDSRVTLVPERFPAAIQIQAAVGCDYMLMNLVREIAYNTEALESVKTGRYMI